MKKRAKIIIALVVLLAVSLVTVSVLLWHINTKYRPLIASNIDALSPTNVIIVFGAGLVANSTRPSDMLHDRLQTAADIYQAGKATSILVSGDNRFEGYSEPDVMKRTLIDEFGIPEEAIHEDYAGRRTYDTCARAHELWGVQRAILVTQGYHLPRALMTCSVLGIDSQGMSASLRPYLFMRRNRFRETLAQLKAYADLYLWPPKYIGGPQEIQLD